jgi:hypothetical protein
MEEGCCKSPTILFTPTKIIYISYVVLLALKIIPWHSFHVFAILSFVFWLVEVFLMHIICNWQKK